MAEALGPPTRSSAAGEETPEPEPAPAPTPPLVALVAKPVFRRLQDWFDPDNWPAMNAALYKAYNLDDPDDFLATVDRAFDEDTIRVLAIRKADRVYLPKDAVENGTVLYWTPKGPRKATVKSIAGVSPSQRDEFQRDGEQHPRVAYLYSGPLEDGTPVYLHKLYAREGGVTYRHKNFSYIQEAWSKVRRLRLTIEALVADTVTLVWDDHHQEGRKVSVAPYRDGQFKIVESKNAWVLYFEWDDGSFVDFDVGNLDQLKWLAEHWIDNPMHGFETFDAYLKAAKQSDGELRSPPPKGDTALEWTSTKYGETMIHRAALPRRGRYEVRRPRKGSPYKIRFLPIIGRPVEVGSTYNTAPAAKKAAEEHGTRLAYGPRGKTRTQKVGDHRLIWTESSDDDRRVCVAPSSDGGEFKLVQIKGGSSFVLFYLRDPEDWDELGCGTEADLKRRAESTESVKPSAKPKKKPPKRSSSKKSTDSTKPAAKPDVKKDETILGGLDAVIGKYMGAA
ncbi:MAG: hypothetical protein KC468_32980 [Myxococcales bacterium]|nr:hypothetical protein [Myxococcales bacterium]